MNGDLQRDDHLVGVDKEGWGPGLRGTVGGGQREGRRPHGETEESMILNGSQWRLDPRILALYTILLYVGAPNPPPRSSECYQRGWIMARAQ